MPSPQATIRLLDGLTMKGVSAPITAGSLTAGYTSHKFEQGLIHSKITLTAAHTLTAAGGAADFATGVKVFDFPTGAINIIATRIKASLTTSAGTVTTPEVGLGTTVASGAVVVLGGTAAFENIHEGGVPALGSLSTTALAFVNFDSLRGVLPSDGTAATALDMHFNIAGAFSGAVSAILASGSTIEFWWTWLEP